MQDDMNCGLTVAERDSLQRKLRDLPETMPPRAVWQRIEQQARAEGLVGRRPIPERMRWLAGAGIAAAVVMAVLNLPFAGSEFGAGQQAADGPGRTVPEYDETADQMRLASINALMVQSQLLERDLMRLPTQPQVMRASTAATIEDLERRIAAIDYQLNHPRIRMTRVQEENFWRARVRLMDSLLRLRYAQAQRMAF